MIRVTVFLVATTLSLPYITSLPVTLDNQQIQYGVVLDAGSSSTKLRIYAWMEGREKNVPTFEEVYYKKFKPGVSAFEDKIGEIPKYMTEVLDKLKQEVLNLGIPQSTWSEIPVYFMATAGLRLLDETITRAIMSAVVGVMSEPAINPFLYEPDFAHILSGEEEALFAWITINYLKKHFDTEKPANDSFGLVELGGGSAQIAFIPDSPIYAGKMPLTIAGDEYSVYCHSHLSYGATIMSERIAEFLIKENPHANTLVNPCMLKGDSHNATIGSKTVGMIGGGNVSVCESVLRYYLDPVEDEMCSPKPCSIGQTYQPPVTDRRFFTFGLVYYLAKDLGVLSGPGTVNLGMMQSKAREYCGLGLEEAVEGLGMDQQWASRNCQDGLYIPLLFSALGFDLSTAQVEAGRTIEGRSLAWSLGAALYEEERNKYQAFSDRFFQV